MSSTSRSTPEPARGQELTDEQIRAAEARTNAGFSSVLRQLRRRSHATYAVCDPYVLHACLSEHLNPDQIQDLIEAEVFNCPTCGMLLKDRHTKVATAIMLERHRLKQLWLRVEERADEPDFHLHLNHFRAALGILVIPDEASR